MLSNHPKRTAVIHVRLTTADRDVIIARAIKAGRSVSDYVRGAAMHYATTGTPAIPSAHQPSVGRSTPASKFLSSADGRGGA